MSLWRILLEGGTPQKLELSMPAIMQMSFHPDGKRLAFTSMGQSQTEIWVLENIPPLKPAGGAKTP